MKIKLLDFKKLKESVGPSPALFQHQGTGSDELSVFFGRLATGGITDLTISSSVQINDSLLLCNRSSAKNRSNYFIITSPGFRKDQANAALSILPVLFPPEEKTELSISAMLYFPKNDCLLFSASSEGSASSPNGYLGIIENAERKIGRKKMKVNDLVELSSLEKKFKGFAIASLSLQSEKDGRFKANIIANNEKGISHLVKIRIKV